MQNGMMFHNYADSFFINIFEERNEIAQSREEGKKSNGFHRKARESLISIKSHDDSHLRESLESWVRNKTKN